MAFFVSRQIFIFERTGRLPSVFGFVLSCISVGLGAVAASLAAFFFHSLNGHFVRRAEIWLSARDRASVQSVRLAQNCCHSWLWCIFGHCDVTSSRFHMLLESSSVCSACQVFIIIITIVAWGVRKHLREVHQVPILSRAQLYHVSNKRYGWQTSTHRLWPTSSVPMHLSATEKRSSRDWFASQGFHETCHAVLSPWF